MITDEVPVPFIETEEYIEIEIGYDELGFLRPSNFRWRINKDYLVQQMRRGCYKMLSAREDFPKVQDPQELVDKTEKIILIAFDRQIEAFLTLRTAGRKFKGVELMDRLITNVISVTLQTALVRETARISNLLGDMYDKYPETEEPTDDDWKETLEKIENGTHSSCYSASGYSASTVSIPTDMYDILKEYYRHRADKEPTAGCIDGLTESILSDFINALEGEFSSPKLREMYDKYLSKYGE